MRQKPWVSEVSRRCSESVRWDVQLYLLAPFLIIESPLNIHRISLCHTGNVLHQHFFSSSTFFQLGQQQVSGLILVWGDSGIIHPGERVSLSSYESRIIRGDEVSHRAGRAEIDPVTHLRPVVQGVGDHAPLMSGFTYHLSP